MILSAWLHRLPDHLSYEEGALIEPLAVALAGIERSQLKLGDSLLICGAGPIGIVTLLSARAAGAEPIVITDLDANRLAFAKKAVPSVRTILVESNATAKDTARRVREAAGGIIPRVALECTGVEASVNAAIYVSPNFTHCHSHMMTYN